MHRKLLAVLAIFVVTAVQSPLSLFAVSKDLGAKKLVRLRSDHPGVQAYEVDGTPRKIYGNVFSNGSSPVNSAARFCAGYSEVFGAEFEDLKQGSMLDDKNVTQPVMFDREAGDYKFTLVYFSQERDGLPVFRSDLRILVRNEPEYPSVLATSQLKNLGQYHVSDKGVYRLDLALATVESEHPDLTEFTEPREVIYAGYDGVEHIPTHAIQFEAGDGSAQKWLFVADAMSGDILYSENLVVFEDIIGTVSGMATEGIASGECNPEVLTPMPYVSASIGTLTVYTDEQGEFTIPYEGTEQALVRSFIDGLYFDVDNKAGENSIVTDLVVPPGPASLVHNEIVTEYSLSQVNAYLHANVVRNTALTYNPGYPTVSDEVDFPVYVNRSDGYCPGNAWYDGSSINFCSSQEGYANTGFCTVVYHEYGHHLVSKGGSGQGQYGEGMSDVMGVILTDSPGLAWGFFGDPYCDYPLRNADNSVQYPCNGGSHSCGRLISGCVWDTRNELVITNPDSYSDILGNLAVNSILLHTGTQITPQITIDWLTLDDNDGNLDNGSPHYDEICAGFGAHNMDCPSLAPVWFEYPDGLPEYPLPDSDVTFTLIVHDGTTGHVSGTAEIFYSIDGGAFEQGTVVQTDTNEYDCTLPGANCESVIDWYITAQGEGSGTTFDPSNAPLGTYSTTVPPEVTSILEDNFESDIGWSVSGNATDGVWERGIPAGDGSGGDPVTDYDGSGSCYLTGNSAGDSDVDGGTTELISPEIYIAGENATVVFAHWLSNELGSYPYQDVLSVSFSSDAGETWQGVETYGPFQQSSGGWFDHELLISDYVEPSDYVMVKFSVSDQGDDSNVEAAIDAFAVRLYTCITYECGDSDGNGDVDIDDAVFLINFIFGGGPAPEPIEAADADCSGNADIDDVVYLIQYIFASGFAPCELCQ